MHVFTQLQAKEIVQEAWADVSGVLQESDAKQKLAAFAQYLIDRDI